MVWPAVGAFCMHGLSSVILVLVNKRIALSSLNPFVVILVQNIVSASLALFFFERKPIKWQDLPKYIPSTMFFLLMLWSSLKGLHSLSIPMFIACRNLIPLITCVLEVVIFGKRVTGMMLFALIVVYFSTCTFAISDFTVFLHGWQYLLLNMVGAVSLPMLEKHLTQAVDQTPTGNTTIRNFLSVPFLVILVSLTDESSFSSSFSPLSPLWQLTAMPLDVVFTVLVSCLLALSISVSYFRLQQLVNVTSITLASNMYKVVSSLFSAFFFEDHLSFVQWVSMFVSFGAVAYYSSLKLAEPSPPALPIVRTPKI